MSENKVMQKCNKCDNEGVNSVWLGTSIARLCQDHLNNLIYELATKGLEPLMDFLNANCEKDMVRQVATVFFTVDEVENYIKSLDELVPMFTYGILKYPANIQHEGGVNIVEKAMLKGHVMYATNGRSFPVTKETGNEADVVYGTYFEVPRSVVTGSYDITEGYSPDNEPEYNMYNRRLVEVTLPDGTVKQANMYVANPSWFVSSMVPAYQIMTGNFDDRATHMRLFLDANEGEG